MPSIRRSAERGHFNHGWLDTWHSFSFAGYHDPRHMGFGALRVLNEDFIAPSSGFGRHGHRDMEILTVVLAGALAHRDSLGNGATLQPGRILRMTAGTGILHSEHNASSTHPLHLLQIWLEPERSGLLPSYEEADFDPSAPLARLASRHPHGTGVCVHLDATLWHGCLQDQGNPHALAAERRAWLQVIDGNLTALGTQLAAGDGLAIQGPAELTVQGTGRYLLFDLA